MSRITHLWILAVVVILGKSKTFNNVNLLVSMSLENLLMIVPDDVVSKKLIGLAMTLRKMLSCIWDDALNEVCSGKKEALC